MGPPRAGSNGVGEVEGAILVLYPWLPSQSRTAMRRRSFFAIIPALAVALLTGCSGLPPEISWGPQFEYAPRLTRTGDAWEVGVGILPRGSTIRTLKLNYGFALPESIPSLNRSTSEARYEAWDSSICGGLPCSDPRSCGYDPCTGRMIAWFSTPGDVVPPGYVVHFNVEVGFTNGDSPRIWKMWSPTRRSPATL